VSIIDDGVVAGNEEMGRNVVIVEIEDGLYFESIMSGLRVDGGFTVPIVGYVLEDVSLGTCGGDECLWHDVNPPLVACGDSKMGV